MLRSVRTLILDEVHAVAGTKRGAHLASELERLDRLVGTPVQRVGLSATQRPLEEIGRFVSGGAPDPPRRCGRREGARPAGRRSGRGHARARVRARTSRDCRAGSGEGRGTSIWPSIYPEVLRLVREHRSTIVFVNNRRLAERLALRLERACGGRDRARASRLDRARAAGRDRGAAEARRDPVSRRHVVARARDRHGRGRPRDPGRVAEVGRARPAARRPRRARARRGLQGPDLPEVPRRPPRSCRDRRAHARGRDRGDGDPPKSARRALAADRRRLRRDRDLGRRAARARARRLSVRRPVASAAGERARHARRPLSVRRVRRAEAADRLGPDGRCDPRTPRLARGSPSRTPGRSGPRPLRRPPRRRRRPRRRARRGDGLRSPGRTDLPARRLDLADRGDHARPRAGLAGAGRARRGPVLEGRGGRPAVRTWPRDRRVFAQSCELALYRQGQGPVQTRPRSTSAAQNLLQFLHDQQAATGAVPSDRTVVVERFRDEIGDWRVCILTPFGARVHAPWALATAARLRDALGLEVQSIWSDDGIAFHLPDADAPPSTDELLSPPTSSKTSSSRRSGRARSSAPVSARTRPGRC